MTVTSIRSSLYLILVALLASLWLCLPPASAATVQTGAQQLHDSGYAQLRGKRVGLITNQTGRLAERHLIDALAEAREVHLVALFAPEHGLRGEAEDGIAIGSGRDARSGVQVHSLYGRTKKPTPAMLKGIDILVFDMQDVGVRFYTFISTMGLAMQAAAEAGIPFLVLDRPNPLGGDYVAGFVLEPTLVSFTGLYPIPIAHGLTVAELARMIKGERLLPGLEQLDLLVVPMAGWQRTMRWPDTGLPWIATSPNIPDFPTALAYAGVGLLEATIISEGRGTRTPFLLAGTPGLDAERLARELNQSGLAGVHFTPTSFTPCSIPGMCSTPKFQDRTIPGVRLNIDDPNAYQPVESGMHMLSALYRNLDPGTRRSFFRQGFTQMAGTEQLRRALEKGQPPGGIVSLWQDSVQAFLTRRTPYLLY